LSDDCFEKIGIVVPEIFLPANNVDYSKWSVLACDQYTSQPSYWEQVKKNVGDAPSTYRITLPEVYLESVDTSSMISEINENMNKYLASGLLESKGKGFVLVERVVYGHTRRGLVVAVDLEKYEYSKGSKALIRATEGTVIERIPPRKMIRKNAAIETPHIMVLFDDPEDIVIGELFENIKEFTELYDTELMQGGGNVKGWMIDSKEAINNVIEKISAIERPDGMLFAVGDGNHSLASAKSHWEDVKLDCGPNHPARFALVELVNIHDAGLEFEPIHRVLFECDYIDFFQKFERFVVENGGLIEIKYFVGENAYKKMRSQCDVIDQLRTAQKFSFVTEKASGIVIMDGTGFTLTVGTLQVFIDDYLQENPSVTVDYIHGSKATIELGRKENNLSILLPGMSKFELFPAVINEGALPRKTFSMGEANEKRYYMECRKIIE